LYQQTHTWKDILKKEGPRKSLEIDERMLYISSRYGTGRWQHEMEDEGGRQEGSRLKNRPTCHIRRGEGVGGERQEVGEEENKKNSGAHFMV
jgi:hypothetical protein